MGSDWLTYYYFYSNSPSADYDFPTPRLGSASLFDPSLADGLSVRRVLTACLARSEKHQNHPKCPCPRRASQQTWTASSLSSIPYNPGWNAEDYAYDPLSDYLPHLYQNEEFGLSFLGGDNVDAHPVSVSDTCIPDAVPNEPPLLLGGARIQYQGSPGHLGMNFSSADASDHSQSVAMVSPVSPRPPGPQADWIDANPLLAPTPDLEVRGLPCTLPPTAKLVQPPLVPAAGSAVIGPVDTSAPSLECLDGCMLCRACSCECAT